MSEKCRTASLFQRKENKLQKAFYAKRIPNSMRRQTMKYK